MDISDCRKASLYTIDNTYLCDADVSDITDTSALLTFREACADILNSEMLVTFYDGAKGVISYYCLLSGYKEYTVSPGVQHSCVLCTPDSRISAIHRRKDIKVPVHIPVSLHYRDREDQPARAAATVHNISAGGVYFTSAADFYVEQKVRFFLPSVRQDVILTAEILRAEAAEEEGICGYGCRFTDLPAHAESSIRGFVFRQDMQRKKR